ncbi:probable chitinase 10 [Neocloeon triangulifer]|uniref:probable chitinase 10 n=1 Tax=Neocloeon triangulifer TaxID=2078957 RepID=UPI00286EBD6F|nr:probable chitinase 10 [Neocloeon triangulifer]
MVRKEDKRKLFVTSVLEIIDKYNMTGFLLNWQYPTYWENSVSAKGKLEDYLNFPQLAEALSESLREKNRTLHCFGTNSMAFLLFFNFKKLEGLIDTWMLPAFHFEGGWSYATAISSYVRRAEAMISGYSKMINPEKIELGIPTIFLPLVAEQNSNKKLGSPFRASAKANERLSRFRWLCEEAAKGGMQIVHNETDKINSYAYVNNDWVSFESTMTAANKATLVELKNLAGVYVPYITADDFDGMACNCGKYPILRAINNVVRGAKLCETKVCP